MSGLLKHQKSLIWTVVVAFMFATGMGCSASHRPGSESVSVNAFQSREKRDSEDHRDRPTAMEVEARLMSYADRYLSKAAEATDLFQHAVHT